VLHRARSAHDELSCVARCRPTRVRSCRASPQLSRSAVDAATYRHRAMVGYAHYSPTVEVRLGELIRLREGGLDGRIVVRAASRADAPSRCRARLLRSPIARRLRTLRRHIAAPTTSSTPPTSSGATAPCAIRRRRRGLPRRVRRVLPCEASLSRRASSSVSPATSSTASTRRSLLLPQRGGARGDARRAAAARDSKRSCTTWSWRISSLAGPGGSSMRRRCLAEFRRCAPRRRDGPKQPCCSPRCFTRCRSRLRRSALAPSCRVLAAARQRRAPRAAAAVCGITVSLAGPTITAPVSIIRVWNATLSLFLLECYACRDRTPPPRIAPAPR
jgi:hypothetical protein